MAAGMQPNEQDWGAPLWERQDESNWTQVSSFPIPASWLAPEKLPKVGTISFRYVCEAKYVLVDEREKLHNKYMSYMPLPPDCETRQVAISRYHDEQDLTHMSAFRGVVPSEQQLLELRKDTAFTTRTQALGMA